MDPNQFRIYGNHLSNKEDPIWLDFFGPNPSASETLDTLNSLNTPAGKWQYRAEVSEKVRDITADELRELASGVKPGVVSKSEAKLAKAKLKNRMKVIAYKDKKGDVRLRFMRSGRIIAESGEGYKREGKAMRTFFSIVQALSGGQFDIERDIPVKAKAAKPKVGKK